MLEHDSQRPAEYRVIYAGWIAEFEPEGYQENRLVEILIQNDWTLKLAQERLMQAEQALLDGWTPERQKEFDARLRSKAIAERSFYRAWSVLRGMQKDLERRHLQLIRAKQEEALLQIKISALKKGQGLPQDDVPGSSEPQSSFLRHILPVKQAISRMFES